MTAHPHPFRTKPLNPDYSRVPTGATGLMCVMCGRPIRNVKRKVLSVRDAFEAIHAEDWPKAIASDNNGRPLEEWEIGSDCATRLGLEWSVPA